MEPGSLLRMRENDALGPLRFVRDNGREALVTALRTGNELWVATQMLVPFPLRPGQRVALDEWAGETAAAQHLTVAEVYDSGGLRELMLQRGSETVNLPESLVVPSPPNPLDPVSYFEALEWGGPHHFFARAAVNSTMAQWFEGSEGLPTLRGARIRPLAHQLHAARRVLEDRVPRFVLADEVGLGKTIEAGLVIQALLHVDPDLNVLVVAPGSMSRQWLCELYLRFGGRAFAHVSAGALAEAPRTERRRLASSPRLIASSTALLDDSDFRAAIEGRSWGLVVVDEAHQTPPGHPLYETLRRLATRSHGFLALSATPSKRELKGLAGLLALVAPDSYRPDDTAVLQRRMEERRSVWGVLNGTIDILAAARRDAPNAELDEDDIEFIIEDWEDALPDEAEVAGFLDRVREGDTEALDELVAYVQEHYRIDHRILRTRRKTLSYLGTAFAVREVEHLEYSASPPEVLLATHVERLRLPENGSYAQAWLRIVVAESSTADPQTALKVLEARMSALDALGADSSESVAEALNSDPGPAEEEALRDRLLRCVPALPQERTWLGEAIGLAREWARIDASGCARHRAVASAIAGAIDLDPTIKVLVFAQSRELVERFASVCHSAYPSLGVATFHHGQSHDQLELAALKFQRAPDLRVLVSDELGGEGRNFQVADRVVHLDTPVSVSRIEQRIGRLDRLGRDANRPVRSVVVRGPARFEQDLQDLHAQVFGVFTRSVGGLEFVLPRLQRELHKGLAAGLGESDLTTRLKEDVDTVLGDIDEDFELSLDSSREQLKQAQELAELLEEPASEDEERVFRHWLGSIGVQSHRGRKRGTSSFRWKVEALSEPLMGYEVGDGSTPLGTFDRELALIDESLQYFGAGHRLVDAALSAVTTSGQGRASALVRDLGMARRGQFFVVVLAGSRLGHEVWAGQPIPAGLQTRAHRFLWPSAEIASLRIDIEEPAELVEDYELRVQLERPYERKTGDRRLFVDQLVGAVDVGQWWRAVREGVEQGLAHLDESLAPLREEAAQELQEALRTEVGYYRGLLTREVEGREEARLELELRERLVGSVREARVDLQGVCLVVGG